MTEKQKVTDRRLMDREFIRGGEKDLQTYLKGLPDESANAQWVEIELHDTDLGTDGMDAAENQSDAP